jgi:putative transposase
MRKGSCSLPGPKSPTGTLIFGKRHLQTILAQYESHYNGRRPHRSRQLRPPRPDHPVADLSKERIQRRPVLGGLIREYERAA